MCPPGTVTLSIEVELGWGVHDIGTYGHLSPDGTRERAYLDRLLDRCVETDIPISFDVVGHLLLDGCDGDHGGPYPPRWFDEDPGTDPETDGRFYAPDAVDRIVETPVPHELCTHTFSHTIGSGAPATVKADLARAQQLHERRLGDRTVALVPPRHHLPPRTVLTDSGIQIVRVGRSTRSGSRVSRFRELLVGPIPTWEPRLVDGVVETYCTTYPSLVAPTVVVGRDSSAHPAFRLFPKTVRTQLHLRALRRVVDRVAVEGGHVTLWCHLYDLANEHKWPPLSTFLGALARRRDAGDVDVLTLSELNDRVRATGESA